MTTTDQTDGAAPKGSTALADLAAQTPRDGGATEAAITAEGFSCWYGDFQALKDVDLVVPRHRVTALIGPSGCG